MTLTHEEMQAALREAQKVAKGTGHAVAIVANHQRSLFFGRARKWRIEPNPTSDHQVIVSGVRPVFPTPEMIEATCAARAELPEAMEALRVLMNRCIKTPGGSPRTPDDVEAMLADLASAIVAREERREPAAYTTMRSELPGYQEPRA